MNTYDENDIKAFFQDALVTDKTHFDRLYEAYKKDFYKLYKLFLNSIIPEINPLLFPTEMIEYLDGNGFTFSTDKGSIYIMRDRRKV